MRIFDKVTGFEWDEFNKDKNFIKHNVCWHECEELFFNEPIIVADDEKHSITEKTILYFG